MKVIRDRDGKNQSINTTELDLEGFSSLGNQIAMDILKLISQESMYPKQIAKKLKMHEQKIYYYIRKLERAGVIVIERSLNINGTIANFYKPKSESFYFKIGEFKDSSKASAKDSGFLSPFIQNGEMNTLVIVGSPDPHGPQKARSRDGYFGMDLALFLGSFLTGISQSHVKLDTEVTDKELEENNLIILGGPIVNKVTGIINDNMPIYFDTQKGGVHSKISDKAYFTDEIGIVNKIDSPFNKENKVLVVAGLRNSGTKAAILTFLKGFNKLDKGNLMNSKVQCRVIEGMDLDSDGVVDNIEFLE